MLLRLGIAAILLSILPWPLIAALPLLDLSNGDRAMYAGILFVIAEVLFYGGILLAGKDVWKAARSGGLRRLPLTLWRHLRDGRPPVASYGVLALDRQTDDIVEDLRGEADAV